MSKIVRTITRPDTRIDVVNIKTGEVLATFDSLYLAKKMVSTINRACAVQTDK